MLLLLAIVGTHSANAMSYGGVLVNYADVEYKQPSFITDGSPSLVQVQVQVGYFFSDYIALESRYATAFHRSSGINVDSLLTGLLKLNMPVTKQVAVYGLVGYSMVDIEKETYTATTASDFTAGVGAHYAFNRNSAITFEFINYLHSDEVRLDSLVLGFQHRF